VSDEANVRCQLRRIPLCEKWPPLILLGWFDCPAASALLVAHRKHRGSNLPQGNHRQRVAIKYHGHSRRMSRLLANASVTEFWFVGGPKRPVSLLTDIHMLFVLPLRGLSAGRFPTFWLQKMPNDHQRP
jgi:hypothetical protein